MFPQNFINEVKEKINLVELVSEYTTLNKVGDYIYQGRCPNPNHNDSSPSFCVFKKGYRNGKKINTYDTWACMGCHNGSKTTDSKHKNYGSDCIAFYQWIEDVPWKKAVMDLCEKYGIPIPEGEFDKLYQAKKQQAESYVSNLYSMPKQYLYDRGLTDSDIKSWKIGYDGNGRITFPLMDRYNNILGFTKRWLQMPEGRNDKYRNSLASKIFDKSSYLYGIHNIDNNFDEIRITEGPMDVILGHKYGAKNIMATLGTAFTDRHVEVIKSLNKVPVLVMDGDGPGIAAGEKAIDKLASVGIYSKILILPSGKDLCDLSLELKDDIENYIEANAITYGQYKVKDIINGFDSDVNELRLRRFNQVKKVIEEIPYDAERMIMKEYINNRMNIAL